MTINRKAVAVAKDVIKQLTLKKIKAERGTYMRATLSTEYSKADQLQKHLKNIVNCRVCALGACLISKVKLYNDFSMAYMGTGLNTDISINRNRIVEALRGIFTLEQLHIIEVAFECWRTTSAAAGFGRRYKTARGRLIGIMRNIIANKGTFRPDIINTRRKVV